MSDDKELEDLLNELDAVDIPIKKSASPADNPKPKKFGEKEELEVQGKKIPRVEYGVTKAVEPQTVALPAKEVKEEDISADFRRMLAKVGAVADEVLDNCRLDRAQAQGVIDHFLDVLEGGGRVPAVYIEKLPDMIRTKNEISMAAIRTLDSMAKLMSASKGSDFLGNQKGNDFSNLRALLEEAGDEGDDQQ